MKDSGILAKIEALTEYLPTSIEDGVQFIHQRLVDQGYSEYQSISDIYTLYDILEIVEREDVSAKPNPWERVGRIISPDNYTSLEDFIELKKVAVELGWEVLERKLYYSFVINRRTFFTIEAVRKCKVVDEKTRCSCRVTFPRITDEQHLETFLDTYNLISFQDREWRCYKDKKLTDFFAEGKYFLLEELQQIVTEISLRL